MNRWLTMIFMLVVCAGSISLGQTTQGVSRQDTAAKLEFDVASVKQNKSNGPANTNVPLGPGDVYAPTGGVFRATNITLITYVSFAYKIMGNQMQYVVRQLPKWVSEDRFDIEGRAAGQPTKDQLREMVRALLADRFKLAIHSETQQVAVLAMELMKPGQMGPRMRQHAADDATCNGGPAVTGDGFPTVCGGIYEMAASAPGRMRLGGRNVTMKSVANALPTRELERSVVDETGLTGNFDFSLEWTPEATPGGSPAEDAGPGLLQALKEQLGLKLEAKKAPMEMLVVDHVELPSEN